MTARLAPVACASPSAVAGVAAAASTLACAGVGLRGGSAPVATKRGTARLLLRSRTPAGKTASSTSPRRAIQCSAIQVVRSSIRRESSGASSSTPATLLRGVCGSSPLRTATQ